MSADVYSPERHAMMWNPVRHGHYHHVHHVAPLPSPQFLSPTQSITVGRSRFVRLALRGRSGFSRLVRASRYSSFFAILASVASLLLPTSLAHTFTHDTFCSQPHSLHTSLTPTAHFRHIPAVAQHVLPVGDIHQRLYHHRPDGGVRADQPRQPLRRRPRPPLCLRPHGGRHGAVQPRRGAQAREPRPRAVERVVGPDRHRGGGRVLPREMRPPAPGTSSADEAGLRFHVGEEAPPGPPRRERYRWRGGTSASPGKRPLRRDLAESSPGPPGLGAAAPSSPASLRSSPLTPPPPTPPRCSPRPPALRWAQRSWRAAP